ncbi:MAG: PhnD/SsuA/transferrin family substrate-binding protein [Pseudomonadales bacterium]
MTASFPWYDLPSVRWANDLLWQAMEVPGELDRETPLHEQWRARDLVISQMCGLDLFLIDAPVEPVLAPVFDIDCEPGYYYSYLIGSPRGRVAAVNSLTSRSGLSALLTICEPESLALTGSHTASLAAVRSGRADVACIDAVIWHILERDAPERIGGIAVVERTPIAPAPPYVVRKSGPRERITSLLEAALADSATLRARQALLLQGVERVTLADYRLVLSEYQSVAGRLPRVR